MSWFFVLYRSKWAPQDETPSGIQLQAEDENQAPQAPANKRWQLSI